MKILLVCSSGGHFRSLYELHPFWEQHEHVWVTFRTSVTANALHGQDVHWAWSPTNRNLPNLFRNLYLAWQVIKAEKPDVILTTGAGVAIPFLLIGRLQGSQTVFIESITRVRDLSLSAKVSLPFLDTIYVHWQQLQISYPKAKLITSSTGFVK
jgi:UDP-N-acetylglucosamine:LPS N-acetylglucosamine transferase